MGDIGRTQGGNGVYLVWDFPSVCYEYVLLPLVNKEVASAYSRVEHSQTGRDIERVGRVKDMQYGFCVIIWVWVAGKQTGSFHRHISDPISLHTCIEFSKTVR